MSINDFKDVMAIPGVTRMLIDKLKFGLGTKGYKMTDEDVLLFMSLFTGLVMEGIDPAEAMNVSVSLTLKGAEAVEEFILDLKS